MKFLLAKPCEFYRRMYNVYAEVCFNQEMFANWLNMGLPLQVRVKETVDGVETHRLSGKERFPGTSVSKEGHADCLLAHERTHDLISLKKLHI